MGLEEEEKESALPELSRGYVSTAPNTFRLSNFVSQLVKEVPIDKHHRCVWQHQNDKLL